MMKIMFYTVFPFLRLQMISVFIFFFYNLEAYQISLFSIDALFL